MIRRPPRSTLSSSSAASDVYKRQGLGHPGSPPAAGAQALPDQGHQRAVPAQRPLADLSLIHISEPTRLLSISYAVFCLKKNKKKSDGASNTNYLLIKNQSGKLLFKSK